MIRLKVKPRRTHGHLLWFWSCPGCHDVSWPIHTPRAAGDGARTHARQCNELGDLIWSTIK